MLCKGHSTKRLLCSVNGKPRRRPSVSRLAVMLLEAACLTVPLVVSRNVRRPLSQRVRQLQGLLGSLLQATSLVGASEKRPRKHKRRAASSPSLDQHRNPRLGGGRACVKRAYVAMIRLPMACIPNPLRHGKDPLTRRLRGEGQPFRMRFHVMKAQSQRPSDSCRHTRETSDSDFSNKDHHWTRLTHHHSSPHGQELCFRLVFRE